MYAYQSDEFEHLDHSRVEEVVLVPVGHEGIDYRQKEVALDDVAIIELILEAYHLPH